eukprot:4086551-Alexandrium_andersonii.AAC.1
MARWLGAWVRLVWRQLDTGVARLAAPAPESRPWPSPVRGALLASGLRPHERLDLRALRLQAEVACPQLVKKASPKEGPFDSTLGFPGEGPPAASRAVAARQERALRLAAGRAASRPPLPAGRPVESVTLKHREQLLLAFVQWLEVEGWPALDVLAKDAVARPQPLNEALAAYGRH